MICFRIDEAEFAGREVDPSDQFIVDDESAADTGPDQKDGCIAAVSDGSVSVFG